MFLSTVITVPPSANSVLSPTFHFRLLPNVYVEPLATLSVVVVPSTCITVTVDATGFVSVLYPIDSNHIRNWIWKNRIKRYRNHERMYICSIAAVGKQCSTLSVAADSGFSVWKRGIHWSRDYIRTNWCIDAYRTWRLCVEICICLLDG